MPVLLFDAALAKQRMLRVSLSEDSEAPMAGLAADVDGGSIAMAYGCLRTAVLQWSSCHRQSVLCTWCARGRQRSRHMSGNMQLVHTVARR